MGVRGPSRSGAGDGVGFAIPAFKRQRQKHHHTYKTSLAYMIGYRSADGTEETLSPNTNNESQRRLELQWAQRRRKVAGELALEMRAEMGKRPELKEVL